MSEHLADDFDGDACAEGDGGSEGVSADMGGEVLSDGGLSFDEGELAGVSGEEHVGQAVVVLPEDVDDGGQEHDVVLRACLDAGGAGEDEVALVLFGGGKVGCHEVGVRESGVALDEEEV